MPDETAIKQWLIKWGSILAVAIFGGVAREAKDRRDGVEFDLWNFTSRLVIACFSGLVVIFLTNEYDLSRNWTGAMAAMAGYSGVEFIECVRRFMRGRWGL